MRLGHRSRNLLIAGSALLLVAVLGGFLRFKKFVDEDPRLCATCHRASPEFALWLGGSHRDVSCQKCHHSTQEQGVAMLRAFLAGRKPQGKHAEVEVGTCAGCHLSHDPRWKQIGESRGHKVHFEERGIACVRCHATSVHGFEPVSSTCVSCHGKHLVGVTGMEKLHCFACHEFLTTEPGLRPTRRDCMRCHTSQGINAPMSDHGGVMEGACAACHKPHAPPGQALMVCTGCHKEMKKGGLHARGGHARCLDCHRPHTWKTEPAGCLRCHAQAAGHAEKKACAACHGFGGAPLPPRAVERVTSPSVP
jgi:predicted CXXCH cytochrome family protein